MTNKNSITYALYNREWVYGIDPRLLNVNSIQVTPEDYEPFMYGYVFCPSCFTPLSRSPKKKNISKNSIKAHYKHLPRHKDIPCPYHTISQKGLNYVNDELTVETQEDLQFKTVKAWAKLPPEDYMDPSEQNTYQGINHDLKGEKTEVPIPRHSGAHMKLGSNIGTVQYICWNLDKLFYVGFTLPNQATALPLKDLLYNSKLITNDITTKPQLFYGKMKGFRYQTFKNKIKIERHNGKALSLYTNPEWDNRRKLNATCIGKYVMFYGSVQWDENNKPYVMLVDWGTYAVIPTKHKDYIMKITGHI